MLRLELLSTEHCTLCEQALDVLLSMPQMAGIELVVVDIALDEPLMQTYAASIPVLRALGEELYAPFSAQDIMRFLDRLAARHQTDDAH